MSQHLARPLLNHYLLLLSSHWNIVFDFLVSVSYLKRQESIDHALFNFKSSEPRQCLAHGKYLNVE